MSAPQRLDDDAKSDLTRRIDALPGIEKLREAAEGLPVYLVGGVVRDILESRRRGYGPEGDWHEATPTNLDVAIEGPVDALAERLGGATVVHERFGTAMAEVDGMPVDIAQTRTETYAHPGALPEVQPASLLEDLARRDFTINAIAIPLEGELELIDPFDGLSDIGWQLRVLHDRSFIDDPTRALRGARYADRFDLAPDERTDRLLREADLSTVSDDRVESELALMARGDDEAGPLGLCELADWGVIDLGDDRIELGERVWRLLRGPPWTDVDGWADFAPRDEAVLTALAWGRRARSAEAAAALAAAAAPSAPSEGVRLARDRPGVELALARASGAEWLDGYVTDWRHVGLEIDGSDLMAAGVPEGPAVGRGLEAALAAKLDGEASGRERELRVALEAAARR